MTRQSDDIDSIEKLAKNWNSAWDRSDAEALLSLYVDDPILMPQGQPVVFEKEAIRSMYLSLFEEYTVKGESKVIEIVVDGDLGYFWSSYTLTARPKAGGDQISSEGKSLFIVRRQADNSWKIARLMDNSDQE